MVVIEVTVVKGVIAVVAAAAVMVVVTVGMEAEIGVMAVGKGATVAAVVAATPTGVEATQAVEATETTGNFESHECEVLGPHYDICLETCQNSDECHFTSDGKCGRK